MLSHGDLRMVRVTEARAHRPARTRADAAKLLGEEVLAGRLDREAARAVLEAAGERAPSLRRALPDGLSEREGELLAVVGRVDRRDNEGRRGIPRSSFSWRSPCIGAVTCPRGECPIDPRGRCSGARAREESPALSRDRRGAARRFADTQPVSQPAIRRKAIGGKQVYYSSKGSGERPRVVMPQRACLGPPCQPRDP